MINPSFGIPIEKVPESKRIIADRERFFSDANAHEAKAIQYRKEKRFWDALMEDAMYFHEMRKCEVFLRNDRVNDANKSLELGLYTPEKYQDVVRKADEFLASWSDESRAAHTMQTSMTRLKLSDTVKTALSADIVKWSLETGTENELKRIIQKYRGTE